MSCTHIRIDFHGKRCPAKYRFHFSNDYERVQTDSIEDLLKFVEIEIRRIVKEDKDEN